MCFKSYHHHQSNFIKHSISFQVKPQSKSTYQRMAPLHGRINCKITWVETKRIGYYLLIANLRVAKIIRQLAPWFLRVASLFYLICGSLPLAHILQAMGDKQSRQRFPEEDSPASSSASGTARGQPRYKPLAPKGPLSGESWISNLASLMPGQ